MKKQNKKPRTKQDKVKPSKPGEAEAEKGEENNPLDFGGLPARDLKKNLGCG